MKNIKIGLSSSKYNEVLRCFAYDVSATGASKIVGLNRNTLNRYYSEFRRQIYNSHYNKKYRLKKAMCEIDESYFGGKRIRGKAGRGAYGKIIVFGIIKRGGEVYTEVIPNCKAETLIPIIEKRIAKSCVVNSDKWKAYQRLKYMGYTHRTINHSANQFALGITHTNSIENFWSFCKQRMNKFHGMCKRNFYLHLKECEFRFNNRKTDMLDSLKKIIEEKDLFFD